ncbi:MAG: hypothetical protein QMD00_03975 [Hadesarchaea archaeon]|nr:hypothetical protein [Hadesarchaea archaeon]
MSSGVAASDVIRSMMRAGFSHDEIYDVLTGTGLPGEQVQLLIDRVAAEFHEAKLEPHPSRLATEVEKVFRGEIEDLQHMMLTQMDSLTRQLELVKTELEKLGRRVVELQSAIKMSQHKKVPELKRLEKSAR